MLETKYKFLTPEVLPRPLPWIQELRDTLPDVQELRRRRLLRGVLDQLIPGVRRGATYVDLQKIAAEGNRKAEEIELVSPLEQDEEDQAVKDQKALDVREACGSSSRSPPPPDRTQSGASNEGFSLEDLQASLASHTSMLEILLARECQCQSYWKERKEKMRRDAMQMSEQQKCKKDLWQPKKSSRRRRRGSGAIDEDDEGETRSALYRSIFQN